jgi:hypothetical protein
MLNSETEVVFPLRFAINLKDLKGKKWSELISRISMEDLEFDRRLAFSWMMVQLCNCASCNADSFRAMRGCIQCSSQAIRRFHGNEDDLIRLYEKYSQEIELNSNLPEKRRG